MNKDDLIRLRSKIVATITASEMTATTARAALRESTEAIPNFLQAESDSAKWELDFKNAQKVYNHSADQQESLRNALSRLDGGHYGRCQECGKEIGLGRLEAMPGATLCIHCQQVQERGFIPESKPLTSTNHVQIRWTA